MKLMDTFSKKLLKVKHTASFLPVLLFLNTSLVISEAFASDKAGQSSSKADAAVVSSQKEGSKQAKKKAVLKHVVSKKDSPSHTPAPAAKSDAANGDEGVPLTTKSKMASMESSDVLGDFDNLIKTDKPTVTTLAGALMAAYDNNGGLQQKRREALSTYGEMAKATATFFPTIDLKGAVSGSQRKELPANTDYPFNGTTSDSSQASLELNQNIFAGGANMAAINAADQGIRAKWAQLITTEQEVFSNVIKAYLDLGTKMATVNVRKAYRAAQQKAYDTSFEKHKIGEETITQVAIAEASLMKADAELRSAEAEVIAAKSTFGGSTGAIPGALQPPKEPLGLPDSAKAALQIALENHPSIIAAKYDHAAAKYNIDQANAKMFSPTVDLNASVSKAFGNTREQNSGGTDRTTDSRSRNSQVGVTLKYNLFAGGAYNAQRRGAHDTALAKRFAIEAAKTGVSGAVVSTFEAMQAAKANIENYKKQVKANEISVNATRQEMEVGTKVLKDVLDQEYNLVQAQISLLNAENAYFTASYKMVELLGGLHAKAMKLNVAYFDPKKFYSETSLGF